MFWKLVVSNFQRWTQRKTFLLHNRVKMCCECHCDDSDDKLHCLVVAVLVWYKLSWFCPWVCPWKGIREHQWCNWSER